MMWLVCGSHIFFSLFCSFSPFLKMLSFFHRTQHYLFAIFVVTSGTVYAIHNARLRSIVPLNDHKRNQQTFQSLKQTSSQATLDRPAVQNYTDTCMQCLCSGIMILLYYFGVSGYPYYKKDEHESWYNNYNNHNYHLIVPHFLTVECGMWGSVQKTKTFN